MSRWRFWEKGPAVMTEAEVAAEKELRLWPLKAETITATELIAVAERRIKAYEDEQATLAEVYPAKMAAWEASISEEIASRIPAMVAWFRTHSYAGASMPLTSLMSNQWIHETDSTLMIPGPPEKPSADSWVTDKYHRIIALLQLLPNDGVTEAHKDILTGLGVDWGH